MTSSFCVLNRTKQSIFFFSNSLTWQLCVACYRNPCSDLWELHRLAAGRVELRTPVVVGVVLHHTDVVLA